MKKPQSPSFRMWRPLKGKKKTTSFFDGAKRGARGVSYKWQLFAPLLEGHDDENGGKGGSSSTRQKGREKEGSSKA